MVEVYHEKAKELEGWREGVDSNVAAEYTMLNAAEIQAPQAERRRYAHPWIGKKISQKSCITAVRNSFWEPHGGETLNVKYSSIVIFTGGLILGAFAEYGRPRLFPSDAEKIWSQQYSEDATHKRIMDFQAELKSESQGVPKNIGALKEQLEVQLKIEDLIIKSREAEYAKITPFTSTAGALLIALISFIAGFVGKKR